MLTGQRPPQPLDARKRAALQAAERAEASAWASWYGAASETDDGRALSLEVHCDEVATCIINPGYANWSLNRVCGIGAGKPPDAAWISRTLRRYAKRGAPCTVSCNPMLEAAGPTLDLMRAFGARAARPWYKMIRGDADPVVVVGGPRVEHVGSEAAESVAAVLSSGFGLPAKMTRVFTSVLGDPEWRAYLAFEGDIPVATGMLYLGAGDVAWLGAAATLPDHRGRGAQSAILSARIREARRMGCRLMTAETGVPEGQSNPSLHNLLRHGFDAVCARPNVTVDIAPPDAPKRKAP